MLVGPFGRVCPLSCISLQQNHHHYMYRDSFTTHYSYCVMLLRNTPRNTQSYHYHTGLILPLHRVTTTTPGYHYHYTAYTPETNQGHYTTNRESKATTLQTSNEKPLHYNKPTTLGRKLQTTITKLAKASFSSLVNYFPLVIFLSSSLSCFRSP